MLSYYIKNSKDSIFEAVEMPSQGCWINVEEGNSEDILKISEITGLGYNCLQDALDKYEIPRIERIQDNILIFIRHPIERCSGLYTMTLTIILNHNYFITISPASTLFIKTFLIDKGTTPDFHNLKILVNLLLKLTQEFTGQVRHVRHDVVTQQKEMIRVDSDDIQTLSQHEETLIQYHSCLVPLRGVVENLLTGKFIHLQDRDAENIQDVLIALKQAEELSTIVSKTIHSLRDSYQIIFTNNLNKTIKLLTALTIIFSIPTMIASLYGMNVSLPFSEQKHLFFILIGMILVSSIICTYLFRKKMWL